MTADELRAILAKLEERGYLDVMAGLSKEAYDLTDALRGWEVTIGPIEHSNSQCQKTACVCWCQACERHNWRHERPLVDIVDPEAAPGEQS